MPPIPWESLLLGFGILVVFYFLLIRPQKKRAMEMMKAQDELQNGDRIMLTSGIFATVRAIGKEQMVVELAPGVEVTCLKRAFASKLSPDSEEFEFADELGELEQETVVDNGQVRSSADNELADIAVEQLTTAEGDSAQSLADSSSQSTDDIAVDKEKPGE